MYRWHSISSSRKHRQGACHSIEELAEKVLGEDARGCDAYFACASFKDELSRKAENALYCKAFWLDIDAGEGKPYGDAAAAEYALDGFCDRLSLPTPHIILSGSGAHAWWPLKENLPVDQWKRCAEQLKRLTEQQGLRADSSRTADPASILRPPGTHNRKRTRVDGNYPLVSWLQPETESRSILSSLMDGGNPVSSLAAGSNASLIGGLSTGAKPDFTVGAPAGERNNTCARYAGWLVGPGNNSYEEALAQCLRWNRLNQPPLEEKEIEDTVKSIWNKERRQQKENPPFPIDVEVADLPAPEGFQWRNGQLYASYKDAENDRMDWKHVTPYPIFLSDVCEAAQGSPGDSYQFRLKKPHGMWQEFIMTVSDFESPGWFGRWCSMGGQAKPNTAKYYKNYVTMRAIDIRREKLDASRHTQFGWKNERKDFLIGDVLIQEGGESRRGLVSESLAEYAKAMRIRGTRDAWTGYVGTFFQPGLEAQAFSIIMSMTAPLMPFCFAEDDGGIVLAMYSEESGKGKSPTVSAICSVWGDANAVRLTGNTTEGVIVDALSRQGNIPIVIEEFTRSDHSVVADRVKNFTVGTDRTRLRKDGMRSGMPDRFQTTLVVACNHDLYQILRQYDPGATSMARVLQITMPDIDDKEFGNITRGLAANCGHAGREIVFRLQQPAAKQSAVRMLQDDGAGGPGKLVQHYRRLLGTTPEHRYIASGLAATHFMGALVRQAGLIEFDYERIMAWGVQAAADRVKMKTKDTAVERLTTYLADNMDTCLVVDRPYNPSKGNLVPIHLPKSKLHMRMEQSNGMLYISTEHLRVWCGKNKISFEELGRKLRREAPELVKDYYRPTLLGAGVGIPSMRCNCWAVDINRPEVSGQVRLEVGNDAEKKYVAVD